MIGNEIVKAICSSSCELSKFIDATHKFTDTTQNLMAQLFKKNTLWQTK